MKIQKLVCREKLKDIYTLLYHAYIIKFYIAKNSKNTKAETEIYYVKVLRVWRKSAKWVEDKHIDA